MNKIGINHPPAKPESRRESQRMRDIPGMVTDPGAYSGAIVRPDDVQSWKKGASGRNKKASEHLLLKEDNTKELQRLYPGLSYGDANKLDRQARSLTRGFNGEVVAVKERKILESAPALWSERTTGREVSPIDWIRAHYGNRESDPTKWKSEGPTRADLKRLDPALYATYASWIRPTRHPEDALPIEQAAPFNRIDDPHEATERRRRSVREAKARWNVKRNITIDK